MADYRYPSNEGVTDRLELHMDPFKLMVERRLIESCAAGPRAAMVDLGAGAGRYAASLIEMTSSAPFTLELVEPDARRFEQLQDESRALNARFGGVAAVRADHRHLHTRPARYDLVLMAHIVEHVTHTTYRDMLDLSWSALAPGGRLIMLCQVAGGSQVKERIVDDSYLHLIDTSVRPNDTGYRVDVDRGEFDAVIVQPRPPMLPVRALYCGDVIRAPHRPKPIGAPDQLRLAWHDAASCEGLIYSFHLCSNPDQMWVGDAIFWADKRSDESLQK